MKMVVCLKQVADASIPLSVKDHGLDPDTLVYVINPADLAALATAILWRDSHGGEVTVVNVGKEAEEVLRFCLAAGADRAVHLSLPVEPGSYSGVVQALEKLVQEEGPDVVFCGSSSPEQRSGRVSLALAERLGWASVANVVAAKIAPDGEIVVGRRRDYGWREIVSVRPPVLLAVEEGAAELQRASLPRVLEAQRSALTVIMPQATGARSGDGWKSVGPPMPRRKRVFVPDSKLSAADRLKQVLSGGIASRKQSGIIEGDPSEAAAEIIRFLEQINLI